MENNTNASDNVPLLAGQRPIINNKNLMLVAIGATIALLSVIVFIYQMTRNAPLNNQQDTVPIKTYTTPDISAPSYIPISNPPLEEIRPRTYGVKNWETYSHTALGFSVKYPKYLFVYENPDGVAFYYEPHPTEGIKKRDSIWIVHQGANYADSFRALYSASMGQTVTGVQTSAGGQITKIMNIKYPGYEGVQYREEGNYGNYDKMLFKKNNNEYFEIISHYNISTVDSESGQKLYRLFLSIADTFTLNSLFSGSNLK